MASVGLAIRPEIIKSNNLKILSDMNWIKLTDELPKDKQNVYLWLQPENGEGRRFNWTWVGGDSEGIMINGVKATHWIDVGEPSDSPEADKTPANCAIFGVMGSFSIDDIKEVYNIGRAHELNGSDCTATEIGEAWLKADELNRKIKWD